MEKALSCGEHCLAYKSDTRQIPEFRSRNILDERREKE